MATCTTCEFKFDPPLGLERVIRFSNGTELRLHESTTSIAYQLFQETGTPEALVYIRVRENTINDEEKGERCVKLAASLLSELETKVRLYGGDMIKKETEGLGTAARYKAHGAQA